MPLTSALASEGILDPAEISFLRQVFEKMALNGDTDIDRETRAAALVRLYQSGVTSEEALLTAFGYPDLHDAKTAAHSMTGASLA